MKVNLTIDGRKIQAEAGKTILEVATEAGLHIPILCHHPALPPEGACRICLVEIERQRALQPACTFPATEGLVVQTRSPKVIEARRFVLEMLLSDHPFDCMTCDAAGSCLLQDLVYEYGVKTEIRPGLRHQYPINDPNPFIQVDRNKCILCRRCIRAYNNMNGVDTINVIYRGFNAHIAFGADTDMAKSSCEFCGSCVAVCPTAALYPKMSLGKGRSWQVKQVKTVCAYCGVGCQLLLEVKDNQIVKVESAWDGPANHGWTCVKGRFGYDYVRHPERLTQPQVRRYLLEGAPRPRDRGEWVTVDWDTALEISAGKLRASRDQFGPEAVGVLASAKCTNEENYLMNKFARQVIGTNNIDHCARLCHSSTVAGLATSFGSGAMSNSIEDISTQANAYFVIGSNTTEQHPVLGMRLRQAVKQRAAILIVADPRRIPLTDFATIHLRHQPGTDCALINGLMHIIIEKGWEDRSFIAERTEGFEELKALVEQYPPDRVSEITGVPVEQLYQAAEVMGTTHPMAVIWAMGITQHTTGVYNVMNLANLQMLLGNMGIPGGGVNPLRGQNNVQGACDMGGLPNFYPAYQIVANEANQKKFEVAWGATSPTKAGQTVTEMIPDILTGKIKALYILGEDPVMSDPDTNHVRHCLEECDFIVLQDIFPTETSPYADVLLPGVSFAEKDGTYTNTERRIQLVRKALEPIGDAWDDWRITASLAQRVLAAGSRRVGAGSYAGWDYNSPEEIMDEIAALSPSYAGVSHARLRNGETFQWPVRDSTHTGTPILHVGKFTRGLGKFTPIEHISPAELPDKDYPMILTTGRVLYHWHGGEMSRRSQGLLAIYSKPLIEVNEEDAASLGLNGSRRVRVLSRRGCIEAEAWITDRVPPGMVYANFHFPEASVNELTIAALDPIAKIPEYKVCAVKVEAVEN
jgi:formate dehydrogenase alpha subunit